jgi:hypothetical protein
VYASALLTFLAAIAALLSFAPAYAQADSSSDQPYSRTHVFTSYGNIQSTQQQVFLMNNDKPLPFSLSGNVQKWNTGPSQENLYTQMFQGLYRVNNRWNVIFSEIYQKQGDIQLANAAVGFNFVPDNDWSFNASLGLGSGYSYTYKYSLLFSPQYRLPFEFNGRKAFAVEAALNYQDFSSGSFTQIVPKLNFQISETLPPISIGYAFGNFRNSGSKKTNQYYQPKTSNGAMVSASIRLTDNSFAIFSYYPNNKNIIGGNTVSQDTLGATWNYKVAPNVHLSIFGQYQNTRNSSVDVSFGGSVNFSF